ncbi:MAG: ferric reductase-like transmembrane domain-containing protein [Desulfuromonas sp.]|nr:ferric reductase-like transmembrane domain-containing protein [Desulfuromonas sp.]
MSAYIKNTVHLQIVAALIITPLLILAVGDYPQRTLLKDFLSFTTIVAFSMLLGLLYLARTNKCILNQIKASKLIGLHKLIGYTAVTILLLHPFLLVIPRFYEAGVAPVEAFTTIITTFTSTGVVLGLIAWSLILLISITSLLRTRLPFKYTTWRVIHGALALLCILCAACHVLYLGRHTDVSMTVFIVMLSTGGIYLLLKSYAFQEQKAGEKI